MSNLYRARRNFYGGARFYKRGETVTFEDPNRINELLLKRVIEPAAAAVGPSETKVIIPQTPPAPDPPEPKEADPVNPAEQLQDMAAPDVPETPQEAPEDIDALSYEKLKERAKEAGIKSYHTMKKEDLRKLLKGGNN